MSKVVRIPREQELPRAAGLVDAERWILAGGVVKAGVRLKRSEIQCARPIKKVARRSDVPQPSLVLPEPVRCRHREIAHVTIRERRADGMEKVVAVRGGGALEANAMSADEVCWVRSVESVDSCVRDGALLELLRENERVLADSVAFDGSAVARQGDQSACRQS